LAKFKTRHFYSIASHFLLEKHKEIKIFYKRPSYAESSTEFYYTSESCYLLYKLSQELQNSISNFSFDHFKRQNFKRMHRNPTIRRQQINALDKDGDKFDK